VNDEIRALEDQLRRSFALPPPIFGPDTSVPYLVQLYRMGYISPETARRMCLEMQAEL
jgi:hypothetical protein